MRRGRILHLEDEPEWRDHVRRVLGREHDVYSASSLGQAVMLFQKAHDDGLEFDVAIIDLSLAPYDFSDHQGFRFIGALEEQGILPGDNIIVLTAYSNVDENMKRAFRDYKVRDVFDKIRFVEQRLDLQRLVDEIVSANDSEAV